MTKKIESIIEVAKNGTKRWYNKELLERQRTYQIHREDGPAIEWADGDISWALRGNQYFEFDKWCKDLNKTDEEITMLKLKYGGKIK